ncbi:MAG: hypothetical protein J7L15_01645 [Clostridiales bacterium]|nr:hypothetical protein [Clostridiales bacterium]
MEYTLVGVCELLSRDACKALGYKIDEFYISYPTLIYSKDGDFDQGVLFFEYDVSESKGETQMRYVPSHLINKTYTIKSGRNKYPELFL